MTHATHYDDAVNQYYNGNIDAYETYVQSLKQTDAEYGNMEEKNVIMGNEQRTARNLGEIQDNEVTRANHRGKYVQVESPISNTIIDK